MFSFNTSEPEHFSNCNFLKGNTGGWISLVLLCWIDISHQNNNFVTDEASKG